MVLIPMRFQNPTVSPDSDPLVTGSSKLESEAVGGAGLAAYGPACNATVASTTTSMVANLRVMMSFLAGSSGHGAAR
jgi:hypothetical protein